MIIPLGDRVLIEPADKKEKTASGIFVVDTTKEPSLYGTVVSKGKFLGKTVVYKKYSYDEIVDDKTYHIIKTEDIIAICG